MGAFECHWLSQIPGLSLHFRRVQISNEDAYRISLSLEFITHLLLLVSSLLLPLEMK